MVVKSLTDLPEEYGCKLCGLTKPVAQMLVRHRKDLDGFQLAPRCKDCQNARERGHRREYKRKYLKRWRAKNAEVNRSYWDNPEHKARVCANASRRWREQRDLLLLQARLKQRGMPVKIDEARELLEKFGPAYPTRRGLTPAGLRECERIRSRMRQRGVKVLSNVEIRMMVYEDGLFIKPELQPRRVGRKAGGRSPGRPSTARAEAAFGA